MRTFGSAVSVIAAIQEDASAEVERIEGMAVTELATIRKEGESAGVVIADRDVRLAAARHTNEERLALQEWEGGRAVIEQREAWMARVVARAREREIGSGERRERLDVLIREARRQVDERDCTITVAARDRALLDAPNVITGDISGGCILTSGDVVFDNSFEARAQRLEPQWRNALANLYRLEPS